MDRLKEFYQYRRDYNKFIFEDYDYTLTGGSLNINYHFRIPGLACFSPSWSITAYDAPPPLELIFSLGMVELLSYWKTVCPPFIYIKAGALSGEQIDWWKKLYLNGLGEFFYTNGIPADDDIMHIISGERKNRPTAAANLSKDKTLIPIGGGKDSVVTLELLKGKTERYCYMINPRAAQLETARAAGLFDKTITAARTLDKTMLELNAQGFLNGHTPFSAIVAFSSVLAAYGNGISNVALSNEQSANEATIKDTNINHQYSKSYEFERDFTEYESLYINTGVSYYSFLRPYNELKIAEFFASYKQYHSIFKSCNAGAKTDKWCLKCPKCLFVYIILSPFLDTGELIGIFGKNILDDPSLKDTFDKLTGVSPNKPFECVGTIDEVNEALRLTLDKYAEGDLPYLLRYYSLCLMPQDKRILILGYGREGRSSYRFLKQIGGYKCLDIADISVIEGEFDPDTKIISGDNYPGALDSYDIIIKSPGVAAPDTTAYITSQTEIFLRMHRERVVGITGTKGKSTAASLLYHILKSNGINCVLAGNIGTPVFDIIDSIKPETVIVLELSCHQLEHIRVSPHIAVLLNIYEDHLDRYGSFDTYARTKTNVCKYQTKDDHLICHKDFLPGECISKIFPVSEPFINTALKGEHNALNCAFVYEICKFYGISKRDFVSALHTYKPLPHRLEFIGNINGMDYYNDSISTTAESAIAAVKAVPNASIILLGGMDRCIDYNNLIDFLAKSGLKTIILMYESGRRMYKLFKNIPICSPVVIYANDLYEAVKLAKEYKTKGGACILSPASASYNDFKDFEERGRVFKGLVCQ